MDDLRFVFYFVCTENKILKIGARHSIAKKVAKEFGIENYGLTGGPIAQDPKQLSEQLSELNTDFIKIICINTDNDMITTLSHEEKLRFIEAIKEENSGMNTGQIAVKILEEFDLA